MAKDNMPRDWYEAHKRPDYHERIRPVELKELIEINKKGSYKLMDLPQGAKALDVPNTKVHSVVYIKQLYSHGDGTARVWKLIHALYGLRTSPL